MVQQEKTEELEQVTEQVKTRVNKPQVRRPDKAQETVLASLPSTSAKIRYLDKEGFTRSHIAQNLYTRDGNLIRYQHVKNVLEQPLKRPPMVTVS